MQHAFRGRTVSAFELWLRTGRHAPVEYKFNGWHDPDDGKFTFKGAGIFHGGGGDFGGGGATGSWDAGGGQPDQGNRSRGVSAFAVPRPAPKVALRPAPQPAPKPATPKPQSNHTLAKGETLSSIAAKEGVTVEQLASVNSISDPNKIRAGAQLVIPARTGSQPGWASVQADRVTYEIDQGGRTRLVRGTLGREDTGRSKALQAQAGKPDRLATDDGGHIVAPRFGGPKAAYNHFAQDANFNRGVFRTLEDQWAEAQRHGKDVSVRIDLRYPQDSQRPSAMEIEADVAGHRTYREFGNVKGGRRD